MNNPATPEELAFIARHFLIAAIWADAPEGTKPRETAEALAAAIECARDFCEAIGPDVFRATLAAYEEAGLHPDCEGSACGAFGHDLYLTLKGHGVGFWDREALEGLAPDDTAQTLGGWLSAKCDASPWEGVHGLEFYRGWTYLRAPTKV